MFQIWRFCLLLPVGTLCPQDDSRTPRCYDGLMPQVSLPSAAIHYRVDGSGPPVLLLHGAGGNSLVWFRQIPSFCQHFTCFAIDQPGFGKSDWVGEPVEYADILAEMMDHFRWAAFGIVGHSLGGWAALRLAHRYPGRVAALVLSSSWAGVTSAEIISCLDERDARLAGHHHAFL